MSPTTAFIGVGANLGDRNAAIQKAERMFRSSPSVRLIRSAPIYETEPAGGPPQGPYLNTVWEVETSLGARELLDLLLKIESELGRVRGEKNGPRVIDLDLLFFGDEVTREPGLTVPHPRLGERWFVLKPLWDLRADWIHPVFKKSICELLDALNEHHPKR